LSSNLEENQAQIDLIEPRMVVLKENTNPGVTAGLQEI